MKIFVAFFPERLKVKCWTQDECHGDIGHLAHHEKPPKENLVGVDQDFLVHTFATLPDQEHGNMHREGDANGSKAHFFNIFS